MAAKIDPTILQVLEHSAAHYEVLDSDPELADTAVFCEHYGYPPEKSANALLVNGTQRGTHFFSVFRVCVP